VEIAGGQREDSLHGRQGRLLLAFLLLRRRRPLSRDELREALWAEEKAPPSEGALSPVLSRLRRALAPAAIEGRDSLTLRLPEPVWIDIEEAEAALARARGCSDAADVLACAREAAALLEPGLLPGLEAPWLREERAATERMRVEALELGAAAARTVDPALGEALAREAVAVSPFRESAWTALIEALRARGNLAEAMQAFDDVRRLLRDELGTVPGRDLLALHGQLLTDSDADGDAGDDDGRRQHPATPAAGTDLSSVMLRGQGSGSRRRAAEDLVEREHELAAVDDALQRAAGSQGSLVLFEGPAGIGKTRLLEHLRARAEDRGALVLEARAGVLEREFAFGVVRQLFEAVPAEVLEGAAAPARVVLSDAEGPEDLPGEGSFPILNGLFRLVERLAASRPLTLCVDDLQWSDPASLRFIAYLARRISGLPVLLGATVRTGEPDADDALLGGLAQEPVAVALNPRPLSIDANRQLIAQHLGRKPDAAFASACHGVTAGNPLLLGQLLSALSAEDVVPDADHVATVQAIGPRAVGRTVSLRLARLRPPAAGVARAVAVLGEHPGLAAIAKVAGTDELSAATAIQALARAEILRRDEPLGFVHPLIRDAVYAELPGPARTVEHERAARVLSELGASPERVAAQLLLTAPRADPWVVSRLREAADVALRRGAPDAAMRLLERAQAEPPPPEQQAALAFELGGSAAYLRGPAGVQPLQRAYAELSDPAERARAAVRLSHLLLFVRSPQEGVELAQKAAEELPAESLDDYRDGLRAVRLVGAAFGAVDPAEFRALDDVRRGPRGTGPGGRALTAVTALALALTCQPAREASALAREAFSGGLDAFEITAPVALASAVLALGEPAEGLDAIDRYGEHARRQGEILGSIGADLWGGIAQTWAGDLRAAMELLERAFERERLWGTKLDAVMAYSAAFTALVQLERGDPTDAVAETLHRVAAEDPRPDGARFWMASLAELALAEGRAADALEVTRRLEATRPPDTHPVWAPWRSLRARALTQLGEHDEARRLALEDLELARRVGAAWVVGRGLRLLAELDGPASERLAAAREAVTALNGTSARLELAKAQLVLAEALVIDGLAAQAAEPAAEAARLADECGAAGLAQRTAAISAGAGEITGAGQELMR
jgi:DNA-binding SARP family transcriptional activator/tetratricopeptide (TPR) repeat protein